MDDCIQNLQDFLQPYSVLEVYHTTMCVHGRIRGYQVGVTTAFYPYATGIDSYYVSLSHGGVGSQQHINVCYRIK